jgi:hypothetical protein
MKHKRISGKEVGELDPSRLTNRTAIEPGNFAQYTTNGQYYIAIFFKTLCVRKD